MLRIMLDADHGGNVCEEEYENRMDKKDILRTALAVGDILTQYGVEVIYIGTKGQKTSWAEKAEIAYEIKPDVIISFQRYSGHSNGAQEGTGSLVCDCGDLARKIAESINCYLSRYHFKTHGIIKFQSETAIFTRLNIPILIQMVGQINAEACSQEFDTRSRELVWAIAAGILETFQIQFNGNSKGVFYTSYREDAEIMEDLYDRNNSENAYDSNRFYYRNDMTDTGEKNKGKEPIQRELNQTESNSTEPNYYYRIQIGLFRTNENALRYQEQLFYNGFDSDVVRQGEFYAVHVGRFNDLDEAAVWEKVLRRAGYNPLLISV